MMKSRCLGIFLVVLVFPLVVLSITLLSTQRLASPLYYKELLAKTDSYTHISALINSSQPEDNFVKSLTANISPQWLKTNTETNLTYFDRFLSDDTKPLELLIDISPFKSAFQKQIPSGVNIDIPDKMSLSDYRQFLDKMQAEIAAQGKNAPGGAQNISNIQQQSASIGNLGAQLDANFSRVRRGFIYFKVSSYIVWGVTLLLLALIGVLARRYPPAIVRWIGYALFLPSFLLGIVVGIMKLVALNWNVLDTIEMSNEIRNLVTPIYQTVLLNILGNMIFLSIIFAIIGLILIIISYLWHAKQPAPSPQKHSEPQAV